MLRFLVQQIFEILFSLWVQAYAGYTEGFPQGMWHCRGMCTFAISKILVQEGGGMVSAHSEGDLAPKKVPWRPCAKNMSFNETFVLHHGSFWIQLAIHSTAHKTQHIAHSTTWCKEYKTELPEKLTRSPKNKMSPRQHSPYSVSLCTSIGNVTECNRLEKTSHGTNHCPRPNGPATNRFGR